MPKRLTPAETDPHTYVSACRVLLCEDALIAGCLDWELIANATGLSVVVVGMIAGDLADNRKERELKGRSGGWAKEIAKNYRGEYKFAH